MRTPGVAVAGRLHLPLRNRFRSSDWFENLKPEKSLDRNAGSIKSQSSSGTMQAPTSEAPAFEPSVAPVTPATGPAPH